MIIILLHKEMIKNWTSKFVLLLGHYSKSNLSIPKIHAWRYHLLDSIKLYGNLNGMTTETFEMSHKFFVKEPYRKTNKHNVIPQIWNQVS
jgi:hypothetical protein